MTLRCLGLSGTTSSLTLVRILDLIYSAGAAAAVMNVGCLAVLTLMAARTDSPTGGRGHCTAHTYAAASEGFDVLIFEEGSPGILINAEKCPVIAPYLRFLSGHT